MKCKICGKPILATIKGEPVCAECGSIRQDERSFAELEHLNVLRALEKARDWHNRVPTLEMCAVENAIEEDFPMESILTAISLLKARI